MSEITMEGLKDFILAFIVISFFAAAGILGLNGLMDSASTGTLATAVNETQTVSSAGIYSPTFAGDPHQFLGIIEVTDGNSTLPAHLYNLTLGEVGGNSYISLNTNYSGIEINVTYSYKIFDASMNISQNGKLGILNTTSFFGIMGTLIGVGLLIGIVFLFTRRV